MKITNISVQAKNPDRVNVSVDGKYLFSLDIFQVSELGVKQGKEYNEQELADLQVESRFGKLYARALEYVMMRPHSAREVKDYLFRKTFSRKRPISSSYAKPKTQNPKAFEYVETPGYSIALTERVFSRLAEKHYIDDEKFARFWVENRNRTKGSSLRKITAELRAKGVAGDIIDEVVSQTDRTDESELGKVIAKKRARYPDEQKFMSYLARQGFSYDDIKSALAGD